MRVQDARSVRPDASRSGAGRIVFANQLRAVAALFVVLSHLGGVFVLMGPIVSQVTSAPEVHVGHPAILFLTCWTWFNFGPLGVAVFFLISGFVIPFSLRSQRPGPFLVARAFRIFPTFWAALLLEWILVHAQAKFYGHPMAFPPLVYVINGLLLDTAIPRGFVDLVNWTLAVEVKFYLLMALLRPWILRGRVLPLIGVSLCAIVIGVAQRHGALHVPATLACEPMYIGFMLIGTLFHYHLTGLVGAGRALGTAAVLVGLFLLCWWSGPLPEQFPTVAVNYLYALVLFAAAYSLRGRFRPVRWLDFLADISFPLYLVHSIIGYSVMTFMIGRLGCSYWEALPVSVTVAMGLAWLLHGFAERPSMGFGKDLARVLSRSGGVSAMMPAKGGE